MKKVILSVVIVCGVLLLGLISVGLRADQGTIQEYIDQARKLKTAGNIKGAVVTIEKGLAQIKETGSADAYTKDYLEFLITCLNADAVTYTALIKHITVVIDQTREAFAKIAQELKNNAISEQSAALIKEMKLELSRETVAHTFCAPPQIYDQVYNNTQQALFRYGQAWDNLYQADSESVAEKAKFQAEALTDFQLGNALFEKAGDLMQAMTQSQ